MNGYLAAVAKHVRDLAPPPGTVVVVRVLHDPACPLLVGTGPCTCEPVVISRTPPPAQAAP